MAVKQIPKRAETELEVEMLRREAHILRGLQDPHIPIVYDYIEDAKGSNYLVLPMYIGGDMLERILKKSGHHFGDNHNMNTFVFSLAPSHSTPRR